MQVSNIKINGMHNPVGYLMEQISCSWKVTQTDAKRQKNVRIEAALDDSNVRRFAQYLNRLTKDTQFIVISHRKGTMEAADILYGITMQEKGVSTLVSVNLIENDLDK